MYSAFLYHSQAMVPQDRDRSIYTMARAFNGPLGISGTLHRQGGTFTQYVEGPTEAVELVKANILQDSRHRNIRVVCDGPVDTRYFDGWAMGYTTEQTCCWDSWAKSAGAPSDITLAPAKRLVEFLHYAHLINLPAHHVRDVQPGMRGRLKRLLPRISGGIAHQR
ncbi:BLUF domain-containing protein [Pseudooceanicola sp. HF7]|uniref:BLUF domain-containing protein n=1 Tax=Pseudooceanicola sp. HF7 TaxID=2721560 RepID=UPI001431C9B7|nr:BLUF domain-containing protein [Pseudooceanicola sp. HF7]